MELICVENDTEAGIKTAELIASVIKAKPDCVLGLATGSSPIKTYFELVKRYSSGELDFSSVKAVNLDEYVGLDARHNQSYAYFMRTNLFEHINIDPKNCYIPDGKTASPEKECENFDNLIAFLGGIDLQLLGLGENGHIGFNEPSDVFVPRTHCVKLSDSTIRANARFFESEEDVPKSAYTIGIKGIVQAKKILMIATGKKKAKAIKDAFFGEVTPLCPASILQLHPDFTLIADKTALSLINN